MPAMNPLTEAEKTQIRELHAAGKTRNAIARELGRGMSTISKYAESVGLHFDRQQTITATDARKQDAKALRAEIQLNLLRDAKRLQAQLFEPAHAFSFGGKDNTFEERTIDEPTFGDKRNIVQAVSTALNASMKLDEHDRAGESGAVSRTMVGDLFHALSLTAEQIAKEAGKAGGDPE